MTPSCGLACNNGRCVFDFIGDPTCECDVGFELKNSECKAKASATKPKIPACDLSCINGRCVFDFMASGLRKYNRITKSLVGSDKMLLQICPQKITVNVRQFLFG